MVELSGWIFFLQRLERWLFECQTEPGYSTFITYAIACRESASTTKLVEFLVEIHRCLGCEKSVYVYHCKNKRVALTQVGLSQLQVHYQTMCIQADQLHCLSTFCCVRNNGDFFLREITLAGLKQPFCSCSVAIIILFASSTMYMLTRGKQMNCDIIFTLVTILLTGPLQL